MRKQVLFSNEKKYNEQYNFSLSLIKKRKTFFTNVNAFINVNTKSITGNKTFGKTVKSTFTEKIKPESKTLASFSF